MMLNQKLTPPIKSELRKLSESKVLFFDPEPEHQNIYHIQDKDLSPWTKQNPLYHHHQFTQRQLQYHKFLANIRLTSKSNKKRKQIYNPQNSPKMQSIKAQNLYDSNEQKQKNALINQQKSKSLLEKQKQNCQVLFLQKRSNLSKNCKLPNSIQIGYYTPPSCVKLSEFLSLDTIQSLTSQQRKQKNKTYYLFHKTKKDKNFSYIKSEQKKFSQTTKDFRFNILKAQKKVSQTLQMNKSLTLNKQKSPKRNIMKSFCSIQPRRSKLKIESNSKTNLDLKNKQQNAYQLACYSKNIKTKISFRSKGKSTTNWFEKH